MGAFRAVLDLGVSANDPLFCLIVFANRECMNPDVIAWKSSPNDNGTRSAAVTRLRGDAIQLGNGGAQQVARNNDPVPVTIQPGGLGILAVAGGGGSTGTNATAIKITGAPSPTEARRDDGLGLRAVRYSIATRPAAM